MTAARDGGRVGIGRGFEPTARRRNRIAAGVALAALAIGGNLIAYSRLDGSEAVLQMVRDVPAGEQITADMLRSVDVDADSSVNVVSADRLDSLIGAYAKVRLVAGSLVTSQSLQSGPLVAPGSSVVAIQIADGSLPAGLRERAPVLLVIPGGSDDVPIVSVSGRVVGLPVETSSGLGLRSLSVEVDAGDATTVAAADDVRVVLVEPSTDPADTATSATDTSDESAREGES